MRRVAWVLVLGLGCGRAPVSTVELEQPPSKDRVEAEPGSARPDAELQALDQCSAAMMTIVKQPAPERAAAIDEGFGTVARCGALFLERCEPELDPHDPAPTRARSMIDACVQRYCPRWGGEARPALCDEGAEAFLELPDGEVARERARGFIAAMLAADYGRPADDPTIERVADRFAAVWAAPVAAIHVAPPPTPGGERPADPLDLHVVMSADHGFVLSGEGIEPIEVPAGDLEGLRREAEALKRRHPGAKTVVIVPDSDVRMQALLSALGVLQGECSGGEDEPACLFPRVTLSVEPRAE